MNYIIFVLSTFYLTKTCVFANECGRQQLRNVPDAFVVGGEDAKQGEFPWYVGYAGCGASLIRENWVLGPGHCLVDVPDLDKTNKTEFKTAYVGIYNTNEIVTHQAKVLKVILHEGYNFTYNVSSKEFEMKNDLGLVKIDPSTLKLKKKLMPICLPDPKVTLTKECWIAGFGNNNNSDYPHYPTTLQKLKDWVSSDQKCLDVDKYYNPTQQICIGGSAKGGTGACRGDSGSAFQCKGTDGRFYQLGLASTLTSKVKANLNKCGNPDSPDIYTRVAHYVDWIEKTIKEN